MKYLVLFALVGILWWVWRKRRDAADESPPSKPAAKVENMVNCAHCGVNLPESDALQDGDRFYCNTAHRDAARRRDA
jgi:uncharacterized protein